MKIQIILMVSFGAGQTRCMEIQQISEDIDYLIEITDSLSVAIINTDIWGVEELYKNMQRSRRS